MKHNRIDIPAYKFMVNHRPPSLQTKNSNAKREYKDAVGSAAASQIDTPISTNDIDVEICWSTKVSSGVRSDIDNIIKPTLDALNKVAYDDDKLVRSVNCVLIDVSKSHTLSGRVEDMGSLLYSGNPDVVQIVIYSNSRLETLGGAEKVSTQRREKYFKNFPQVAERHITRASRFVSKLFNILCIQRLKK